MSERITEGVRQIAQTWRVSTSARLDLLSACDAIDAACAAKDARIAELERDLAALTAERDRLREACKAAVTFFNSIDDNDTHAQMCRDALSPPAAQSEPKETP